MLDVDFSMPGSSVRELEEAAYVHLIDLLDDCEGN